MKSLREAAEFAMKVLPQVRESLDASTAETEPVYNAVVDCEDALRSALAAEGGRVYWRVDLQRPDTGDEWHHAFNARTLEQAKENKAIREHEFSLRGNVYRIVRVCETVEPESEGGGK